MSHAITFNTLAVVRRLEASGINAQQSEAITESVAEIFETTLTTFATKSDIQQLDMKIDNSVHQLDMKIDKSVHQLDTKIDKLAFEMETNMDKMTSEFDGKLSKLKSELIIWVVIVVFAQTAILSIIKFMHPI